MDIKDLPIPQSRVEMFLNYICEKYTKPEDNNSTDNNSTDNNSTDNNSTDNNSTDNNINNNINYFSDVILTESEFNNSYLSSNTGETGNRIFGTRSLSSSLFYNGYVKSILVYIQTKGTGDSIGNIKIWSVNKTETMSNDTVKEYLGSFTCEVKKHSNGDYYIEIPIDKQFETDTYFIYHLPTSTGYKFRALKSINSSYQEQYINMAQNDISIGSNVSNTSATYTVHIDVLGNLSLKNELNKIKETIIGYEVSQNRLLLTNRYSTDAVGFNLSATTLSDDDTTNYDNDLYNLILNNILVGKYNYDRAYMENLIQFYWMDFSISDEMYSTLSNIIEEQYTEKENEVLEESPIE